MIRQDFILRLIEQFAQTLARSLNSAKEGDFENSEKNLESDFNGLLGDRYGDLDAHDEQQIIKVILDEEGPLCGRDIAALVSAYFHARYTVLNAKGDRDAALNYLERSIGILLQLSLLFEPAEFPNIVPKMEHLLHEHLETGKPLGKYQLALAGYFEKTGQYQLTIDILEETIKEQSTIESPREIAEFFTRRLEAKSDEDLISGGLERSRLVHFRNRLSVLGT